MKAAVALIVSLATGLLCRAAAADGFEVRLAVSNAHLLEVVFGCHATGSDGFDRDHDDFAPPPGIDTGYVGFIPKARLPLLYRDIRGPKGPHEWVLQVRPAKDRPVTLSWDPRALPAGWTLTVVQGDTSSAMTDTAAVAVTAPGNITFRAVEKAPTAAP